MAYRWAIFRNKHPLLGSGFELFVIALLIFSVVLPLVSESMFSLATAASLWLFGLTSVCVFARSEKYQSSMPN